MKNSFRLSAVALSQVVILNWGGQPEIPVEQKAKKAVDQAEEAFNAPAVEEDESEAIVKQEKSPAKGFGN
jgi:hypothetical protein